MRLAPLAAVALPLGFVAAQPRPVPRPETIGLSAPALARIKPALQAYVDAGKLAGIVGVVARHGKVGYLETVGRMDLALQTPMRADAVFRIFSMTKPVIAVAVLRLMDQGKLQLEDPVSKFIPAFGPVKVYAGGSAASPSLRDPDGPITIRHLLTHTAGLTYGFFGETPVDSLYRRPDLMDPALTVAQFADRIAGLPLVFSPGKAWNYSMSIDVLGRVVEVASGRPLDRFLEEEIFTPLGMKETAFHVRPEMTGRVPVLYVQGADGKLKATEPFLEASYLPTSRFLSGGGGLLSTPADYLRFAQMILNRGELDGRRILERRTVAQLVRNHLPPALTPLESPLVGQGGYGHGLGGVVLVDSARAGLPGSPGIYRWWGYAGTTGLLELAEAFANPAARPRRSMLFVAVSGEERGLWGSEYYAKHPSVPIERIVANINMDHLGRNWRDSIVVIGREHSDLGATVDQTAAANRDLGVGVLPDQWPTERIYFRSDHYNFARNGVPILFFTNGFHPDYHAVTDSPDKIDAEKQARVVRLIFETALAVANRTERPQWNPESARQIIRRQPVP